MIYICIFYYYLCDMIIFQEFIRCSLALLLRLIIFLIIYYFVWNNYYFTSFIIFLSSFVTYYAFNIFQHFGQLDKKYIKINKKSKAWMYIWELYQLIVFVIILSLLEFFKKWMCFTMKCYCTWISFKRMFGVFENFKFKLKNLFI